MKLDLRTVKAKTDNLELRVLELEAKNSELYRQSREKRYRDISRSIDFSANSARFQDTGHKCKCQICNGEYPLVMWKDRKEWLWPDKRGSCIFHVMLQTMRIDLLLGRPTPIDLLERITKAL